MMSCRSQDIDFGDEPYNDGDANSDVASTAQVGQSYNYRTSSPTSVELVPLCQP